jgi:hypothetical protein
MITTKRRTKLYESTNDCRTLAYRASAQEYNDFISVCNEKKMPISSLLAHIVTTYVDKFKAKK